MDSFMVYALTISLGILALLPLIAGAGSAMIADGYDGKQAARAEFSFTYGRTFLGTSAGLGLIWLIGGAIYLIFGR